jgi:hypothetical protein
MVCIDGHRAVSQIKVDVFDVDLNGFVYVSHSFTNTTNQIVQEQDHDHQTFAKMGNQPTTYANPLKSTFSAHTTTHINLGANCASHHQPTFVAVICQEESLRKVAAAEGQN